jgi:hypothetical protein
MGSLRNVLHCSDDVRGNGFGEVEEGYCDAAKETCLVQCSVVELAMAHVLYITVSNSLNLATAGSLKSGRAQVIKLKMV